MIVSVPIPSARPGSHSSAMARLLSGPIASMSIRVPSRRAAQEGDRVISRDRRQACGDRRAAEPVLVMHMGGVDRLLRHRPRKSRDHGNLPGIAKRQAGEHVPGCERQGHVAENGRHGHGPDAAGKQQYQRLCMVDAAVGTEDQRSPHATAPARATRLQKAA